MHQQDWVPKWVTFSCNSNLRLFPTSFCYDHCTSTNHWTLAWQMSLSDTAALWIVLYIFPSLSLSPVFLIRFSSVDAVCWMHYFPPLSIRLASCLCSHTSFISARVPGCTGSLPNGSEDGHRQQYQWPGHTEQSSLLMSPCTVQH